MNKIHSIINHHCLACLSRVLIIIKMRCPNRSHLEPIHCKANIPAKTESNPGNERDLYGRVNPIIFFIFYEVFLGVQFILAHVSVHRAEKSVHAVTKTYHFHSLRPNSSYDDTSKHGVLLARIIGYKWVGLNLILV